MIITVSVPWKQYIYPPIIGDKLGLEVDGGVYRHAIDPTVNPYGLLSLTSYNRQAGSSRNRDVLTTGGGIHIVQSDAETCDVVGFAHGARVADGGGASSHCRSPTSAALACAPDDEAAQRVAPTVR